jgi:hypothetical protein
MTDMYQERQICVGKKTRKTRYINGWLVTYPKRETCIVADRYMESQKAQKTKKYQICVCLVRYVSVWCDMCLLGVMCNMKFDLSPCGFYVSRPIEARTLRKRGQQISKP